MASEARISLVWVRRDFAATGRNDKPVAGSVQIAFSISHDLVTTSISPLVAFGASSWLYWGWRRSPSNRVTRGPPRVHSCAKDFAIEDFPSLGSDEVMPMTLLGLATLPRSMAIFTARIDSAKRESGESIT